MFELIFLGTSASAPSIQRGLPAQVVKHNEHRFLVDCGEGTQRQILQSGIGFKKLNRMLLTHGHLDHILGIGGLVSTFLRWETIDKLEIFGGSYTLERVEDLLLKVVIRGVKPPFPVILRAIKKGPIIEEDDFSISAFPVKHRGAGCFGFCFQESSKRPFLAEKADKLGIPSGPMRRDLVQGKEVVLPDGKRVKPDDILGEPMPGTKLVMVGDTAETKSLEKVCQDADALVIEGTYLYSEVEMARQYGHLTVREAAELAAKANVKQLYITHVSRRYRDRDIEKEATSIFPNSVLARDFDQFQIKN